MEHTIAGQRIDTEQLGEEDGQRLFSIELTVWSHAAANRRAVAERFQQTQ